MQRSRSRTVLVVVDVRVERVRFHAPHVESPISSPVILRQQLVHAASASARIALLSACANRLHAGATVEIDVPLVEYVAYPRRLFGHLPLRALAVLSGRPAATLPMPAGTVYFACEDFLRECDAAGLGATQRHATVFTVHKGPGRLPRLAAASVTDHRLIIARMSRITRALEHAPPKSLVQLARSYGRQMPRRTRAERLGLREAIALWDAFMPGRSGCYRRTLTEAACDGGAARERMYFALDVGATGHAWLADSSDAQRSYDVIFTVEPEGW